MKEGCAPLFVFGLGQTAADLAYRDSRYLLQLSLTIFRPVTVRSAYSVLLPAFSTCPSFFSSAFVSWVVEPVTITFCPRCSSNLTLVLRSPQVFPSSPVMENSPGSSPFCRQPVTVCVDFSAFFSCFSGAAVP